MTPATTSTDPLRHLIALELGPSVAVSCAGRLLADLGAQVVKRVNRADDAGLALDVGKTIRADGAVGVRATVLAVRPNILLCGPEIACEEHDQIVADLADPPVIAHVRTHARDSRAPAAEGLLATAVSGLMTQMHGMERRPYCLAQPAVAVAAGAVLAVGALALQLGRQRGLPRREVHTTYERAAVAAQGISACFVDRPAPGARGYSDPHSVTNTPAIRFHEVRDGWILIGAVTRRQWVTLLEALGAQHLIDDPGLAQAPLVVTDQQAGERMVAAVATALRNLTVAEAISIVEATGAIAAPALTHAQFLAHPQPEAIGMIRRTVTPAGEMVSTHGFVTADESGTTTEPLPSAPDETAGPLSGVRLLEMASFMAAPNGVRVLAELGADVVKVEPPDGDNLRPLGLSFTVANRGKRSIALDARHPDARPIMDRLVATCDVIVTNMPGDRENRFGIDSVALAHARRPKVKLRFSGYGARGPLAGRPIIDAAAQALVGQAVDQGAGVPTGYTGAIVDSMAGWVAATGVLAGLIGAQAHGDSYVAETSLLQVAALFQGRELTEPTTRDTIRVDSERKRIGVGVGLYQAADGWMCLAAGDLGELTELMRRLGLAPSAPGRWDDQVEHTLATMTCAEIIRHTDGLPVARVRETAELADDDELMRQVDQPPFGPARIGRFPLDLRSPDALPSAPAKAGADTVTLLHELGFAPDGIADLLRRAVVTDGSSSRPLGAAAG